MNRTEPHRRRLFLKTLLAAAAPVPAKAFSGAGRMEREILDAIHSLILLKEEKDIELFLKQRMQQVDEIEKDHPRYTVAFRDRWHPFSRFVYLLGENSKLKFTGLNFKEIRFAEIRKEFSQIYFQFIERVYYMVFIKKLSQGTLCFFAGLSDSWIADDYEDLENGVMREEKLSDLLVNGVSMYYGRVLLNGHRFVAPSYEQN